MASLSRSAIQTGHPHEVLGTQKQNTLLPGGGRAGPQALSIERFAVAWLLAGQAGATSKGHIRSTLFTAYGLALKMPSTDTRTAAR